MPPKKTKTLLWFLLIFTCFINNQGTAQNKDWFKENLRKVDPTEDQWLSEKLHDEAKKQLKLLFNWACHKKEFPLKIFAKEFRGTPMRAITLKDISQNTKYTK